LVVVLIETDVQELVLPALANLVLVPCASINKDFVADGQA